MLFLDYTLDFGPVLNATTEFMWGVLVTLGFSLGTVFFGTILGFAVSMGKLSRNKVISAIASFYISFLRGTPLLIQLYILAYGIPILFGFNINIYISGLIALSLNSSAYVAEIFRSGIQAVDPGQIEGARSIGLSSKYTMRHIIFPQALKNILPAIGNELVTVVKESSVVSLIGIGDITRFADLVKADTLKVFEALIYAALLYYIITTILSQLIKLGERKLNKYAAK
jgi:His/Glu/Gln/Arg/opine family amino acid ABC transporter permease subunit